MHANDFDLGYFKNQVFYSRDDGNAENSIETGK